MKFSAQSTAETLLGHASDRALQCLHAYSVVHPEAIRVMRLMGHAHIQTTLIYVHVTPLEVYQQYARAVAQHIRPIPVIPS